MAWLRAFLIASLLGVGLLAAPATAQAAPGDLATVCGNPVPDGWVVVAFTYSSNCGSGPALVNAWRIQQVAGMPIGSNVQTCYGTPPPGWDVVISGIYMAQCSYNPGFPGYGYVLARRY
ncbi:MAG TPA: hypothetical protein VMU51_06780 [Mycobacteriales bacterium]|nr:hypothetical protein [Mycobacteriales bacterium]